MIDVCICALDPEPGLFGRVLEAVAHQSLPRGAFAVVVVDNASSPAIDPRVLQPLGAHGISAQLWHEPQPGLQHARLAATRRAVGEWLVWVDADNVLPPTYLQTGAQFAREHPGVGCFGGDAVLAPGVEPKRWMLPFLPYLGIRAGEGRVLVTREAGWTAAEPLGAGAWVHRTVAAEYAALAARDPRFFALGRTGHAGLASCDDSLMMRCAFRVGRACAYVPTLRLYHHIDLGRRTRFVYLIRLMYAYGVSHVALEQLLGDPPSLPRYRRSSPGAARWWRWLAHRGIQQSLAFSVGFIAYCLGARVQQRRHRRLSGRHSVSGA